MEDGRSWPSRNLPIGVVDYGLARATHDMTRITRWTKRRRHVTPAWLPARSRTFLPLKTTKCFKRLCMYVDRLSRSYRVELLRYRSGKVIILLTMKQSDRCFEELKRRSAAHMLHDANNTTLQLAPFRKRIKHAFCVSRIDCKENCQGGLPSQNDNVLR